LTCEFGVNREEADELRKREEAMRDSGMVEASTVPSWMMSDSDDDSDQDSSSSSSDSDDEDLTSLSSHEQVAPTSQAADAQEDLFFTPLPVPEDTATGWKPPAAPGLDNCMELESETGHDTAADEKRKATEHALDQDLAQHGIKSEPAPSAILHRPMTAFSLQGLSVNKVTGTMAGIESWQKEKDRSLMLSMEEQIKNLDISISNNVNALATADLVERQVMYQTPVTVAN